MYTCTGAGSRFQLVARFLLEIWPTQLAGGSRCREQTVVSDRAGGVDRWTEHPALQASQR
jgi:hypothetical protein